MSGKRISAQDVFPNFTHIPRRLPELVIWAGVCIALTIFVATITLLFLNERVGLTLFWGLEVPFLPLLLVVAPGLWRAVCPLSFANQLPKRLGIARNRRVPAWLADKAFMIAVLLFVGFVGLRHPVLNSDGPAVAVMLILAAFAAFTGGFFFAARSGWCGTFCPLGPIQREYGHAPAVLVPNIACTQCVGCQSGCYDFAPQATLFDDVLGDEPDRAAQRRFVMSMIAGMIAGYFLQLDATYGYGLWFAFYLGAIMASSGLYQFAIGVLRLEPARTASFFAATALTFFYLFSGPAMVSAFSMLTGIALPAIAGQALQGLGGAAAALLFFNAHRLALRYEAVTQRVSTTSAFGAGHTVRELSTGRSVKVDDGETLLSAMRRAGFPVSGLCRAGQCGSDAFRVVSGAEHLSAAGNDEKATLARLGLGADMRLACQCLVNGEITIDLRNDTASSTTQAPRQPPAAGRILSRPSNRPGIHVATLDAARLCGAEKVVIIGNGVAGMTVAEEVRKLGPTVAITLVSAETHSFYNRMALGRVIAGEVTLPQLRMVSASWAEERNVEVKLGTRVSSIDRRARKIITLTGESIDYDRLILATGARAAVPVPEFLGYANTFVLRNAGDAAALSQFIARRNPKRALVIGGGVLGVEAAEALGRAGLSVGIVHRGPHLIDHQLDAVGGAMLERYLAGLPVDVTKGVSISGYDGQGSLSVVRAHGVSDMKADLFVAAIGNVPNTELARECGLFVRGGIVVDRQMRTSDPAIFAIGDCAEFGSAMNGLWPEAIAQARIAALGLLSLNGEQTQQTPVLQLKSDGIDVIGFGAAKAIAGENDEVLTAAAFDTLWWRFVIRDGEIVTACFVGPPGSAGELKSRLKKGRLGSQELLALRSGRIEALTSSGEPADEETLLKESA